MSLHRKLAASFKFSCDSVYRLYDVEMSCSPNKCCSCEVGNENAEYLKFFHESFGFEIMKMCIV